MAIDVGCTVVEAGLEAGWGERAANGPLLLSLKDAGKALGLTYSMVYELVNRGDLEHVLVGSRRYIAREAALKFIEQHTHQGYHRR